MAVSPEDDAEVRRVSISNLGNRVREIELTSYAEVVLAPDAADAAHPAFSNLFVQTEFVADIGATSGHTAAALARRRPSSGRRISRSSKASPWAARNSRPIGRVSSDAGARFARRSR